MQALADREHDGPFGEKVTVSRQTIDRWCRWWRAEGFAGLVPQPAQVPARTPGEVLDMAAGLKREAKVRVCSGSGHAACVSSSSRLAPPDDLSCGNVRQGGVPPWPDSRAGGLVA